MRCPRRMLCSVDPGFGTLPSRTRMSSGITCPAQSGSAATSRSLPWLNPCSDSKCTPLASPIRTVSRMLAVRMRRSLRSVITACALIPVIAGSALTMFTTSFVHCAPTKFGHELRVHHRGEHGERVARGQVVVRGVAAEVDRSARGDRDLAGGEVRGGEHREPAHDVGARCGGLGGRDAVEPVLHHDDRDAAQQRDVVADRGHGILRLRRHDRELRRPREQHRRPRPPPCTRPTRR